MVGVKSLLAQNPPIGYRSVSDRWGLADAVRKLEFELLQIKYESQPEPRTGGDARAYIESGPTLPHGPQALKRVVVTKRLAQR
jgi:hypothetical protein